MQSRYDNNDTLNQILEFNKKSNSYEYGMVVNGRLDTELNDFVNNYRLSNPLSNTAEGFVGIGLLMRLTFFVSTFQAFHLTHTI